MIRVAFSLSFKGLGWLGGVNYFRNLFHALHTLPNPKVTPVIISPPNTDLSIIKSFGVAEVHISKRASLDGLLGYLRRVPLSVLGRDIFFERYLKRLEINFFSHSGYLGNSANIPSLPWIPDFQDKYLPGFFSAQEIALRDRYNRRIVSHSKAILLSSEHAREGLAQISQRAADDAFVLPFVAATPHSAEIPSVSFLERKYGEMGDYFFLPNQFWVHKNHEVVIRALAILRQRGRPIRVLATGNPRDPRQPQHFDYLKRLVSDLGVAEDFRFLGVVPYLDLMGLMVNSVAVINPSFFEGWSSTVEEAKSLGKLAVISDIPVHREQSPSRAVFFDPRSPDELSSKLLLALQESNKSEELRYMDTAEMMLPERLEDFALRYESIVQRII